MQGFDNAKDAGLKDIEKSMTVWYFGEWWAIALWRISTDYLIQKASDG